MDRLGFLVGVELLAGDVLHAAVDMRVAVGLDLHPNLCESQLLVGGVAVKSGDELIAGVVGTDDHRDEQAAHLD